MFGACPRTSRSAKKTNEGFPQVHRPQRRRSESPKNSRSRDFETYPPWVGKSEGVGCVPCGKPSFIFRLSTNARTPKPPAGIFIIPVAGSENLFHLAWESLGEWEVWLVGNHPKNHPTCSERFFACKASRCRCLGFLALGQTGDLSRQITPRPAARFKRSEGRAVPIGFQAAWPHKRPIVRR